MKSFRNFLRRRRALVYAALGLAALLAGMGSAWGALPYWIRNVEARGALEAAFFRAMSLPGGEVLFRRPPSETRPALRELVAQQSKSAELYSLLALEDEQQLDFSAAEVDWKRFVEVSGDKASAQSALADFYHRRLRPAEEIAALTDVANTPSPESDKLLPAPSQRSWNAFVRIFAVIQKQGLPRDVSIAQYRAWIKRYSREPRLYANFLGFLIAQKDFNAASELIAEYQKQFPGDTIFQVRAKALVEYQQGSLQQGLAVYEKTFQPLWDPELVKSYFDLLGQTQSLRKFLDDAHAAINTNPEDLNATARVFYYYQQQGKFDAAQEAVAKFSLHKESARTEWKSQELYVCARLLEGTHSYPESARYYFALYNAKDASDAQEKALAGLARLLLTAPETPIRFGSGELSMYKDIATMDQGPGYLNGILSLILNTTSPDGEFVQEEQRAVPYFHRSRAAELLALLDGKFPNSGERSALHAKLLEYYAGAGENDAVIKGGKQFLAAFPKAGERTEIALLMADAYARTGKSQEEFAIYDAVLKELAANADGVPLGTSSESMEPEAQSYRISPAQDANDETRQDYSEARGAGGPNAAFQVATQQAQTQGNVRSPEYARVLERYLARLVEQKQTLQAVAALRNEIEHNPGDPGLYERLAAFLEQNRLGAEQEEVYKRAIAKFSDRSWYHKLARYYLRRKQEAEFASLTENVVKIFDGTGLERYFEGVVGGGPALYLRLNLYANQRFPHNPVFVRNLLSAYRTPGTYNAAAWEALLRQHWFEEDDLRNQLFEYLAYSRKLETELAVVRQGAPTNAKWDEFVAKNPAAGEFIARAELWRSHFEASAPALKSLSAQYPAQVELGNTTAAVFRSLAYLEPSHTETAVKVEENLLAANPGSTEMLAKIGDTYADRELFAKASPYWERIPKVAPGEAGGYLDAATIYWDYFDFDNALRLLNEARKKFGDGSLYAYEEGAIYEGKREYPRAIEEYAKGGIASGPESPAELRLLQLARRAKFRDLVDEATKKPASTPDASLAAITLRVRVLETQERKKELAEFLDDVVGRAATIERASQIEALAQQRSLETVRQHAIEKQAALTTDPVARLQLRYTLARLYEEKKDFASAQRNVEALYRENSKILGVVRATVDFYWRLKLYPQAIGVLQQAAKDAYPQLSKQFQFEAARKSTDAKLYAQAREILAPLLKESPYDSQYLAAMADTYAREGDQQGLKKFYLDEITAFRSAPLSQEAKKALVATLRRGLIPALTRLQEYPAAVDQYIELINAFPEDEALTSEAALYSARYGRKQQLEDYYSRTIQQSPRDYHWPMVLARVQATLEDYAAAIDTFGKAIAIRPDRADLRTTRAGLMERLMRFDEAAADYTRIYELSYKDPQWMEKIAEIRARQGKTDDAVAALKTALIDGRPERPEKYFEAARRLEGWGMLTQALTFAEQGVAAAGDDLLAATENRAGATLYVRIMTRLRQQAKAYATLQNGLSAAGASLPVVQQQVAKQGIAAITDSEWRKRTLETRVENARSGMKAALVEMGNMVARYFTPEEKVAFVQFARSMRAPMGLPDVDQFAVPLAESAALGELEAQWRFELLMKSPRPDLLLSGADSYTALQRKRLKFDGLARDLEQFAPRLPGLQRPPVLLTAAGAYRSAGDPQNELRVLSSVPEIYMGRDAQNRYLELLLQRQPQQLVQMSANWTPWGQQVADFVVANGDPALVRSTIVARGRSRPPVWTKAYSALAGLYFSESDSATNASFLESLGDQTIGERIGKPVDRNAQLAGDIWFYYGSRYGEYLGVSKQGDPEDFLAAELERSPASASGYLQLADYYAETGDTRAAIADYNHVLELMLASVEAHDRLALAYFRQGSRAEAVAQWNLAIGLLAKQVDRASVPETLWADFGKICDHLGSRRLFAEVKPEADSLVRNYLRHNGNYRSNALLRSGYSAQRDAATGVSWILDVSSAAPDPALILQDLVDVQWIPLEKRGLLYPKILEARQNALEKSEGFQKNVAQDELRSWQIRWARYLVQTNQFAHAGEFLAALPEATRQTAIADTVPLELQVAAKVGTLDVKLTAYRSSPEAAPSPEILRAAARRIFDAGDKPSARKILEYVFAREIEEHRLVAANFLGLAEIRLAAGDMSGALELLHRLTIAVGAPFENLDPAAALLEKTGHSVEAAEFLQQLVKANPWDDSFALRLAKARIASGHDAEAARDGLAKTASSQQAAYRTRLEAAAALAGSRPSSEPGSAELRLLFSVGTQTSAALADKPFFYEARIRAAQSSRDANEKLRLLENAIADTPARNEARLPLFQAAIHEKHDELAVALFDSYLSRLITRQSAAGVAGEEEIISTEDAYDEDGSGQATPDVETAFTPAQQAGIAYSGGEVLSRLGRLSDALRYLESARKLEKNTERKKEITISIAGVRSKLRRQQQNLARQPILHDALEQDRVVRPRIVPPPAPPAASAATKKGA